MGVFPQRYAAERARLVDALGDITDGGLVEGIQHVGSTSVPGMPGSGILDIALSVWPFPLAAEPQARLAALGYRPVPGFEGAANAQTKPKKRGAALKAAAAVQAATPEQRFAHQRRPVQLLVVEPGSEQWHNFQSLREYLAGNARARARPAPAAAPAKARHLARLLARANVGWVARHGFAPVEAVAAELAGFDRPWHIASGWALDLFLGRVTRVHHDVDVEIARADQLALRRHLEARGWKFVTPYAGQFEPWPPDMRLEGERHQAHAHRDGAFIDCLLTEIAGGVWYYRRQPAVARLLPRAEMVTSGGSGPSAGLPYLAPELVLLFKSKNTSGRSRPKDQADFERVFPQLEPERRAWLRWALAAADPGHAWIERLA